MSDSNVAPDWLALWRSGVLPRFGFISLGLVFHAGCENMISTIVPAMVKDIGGVQLNGWSFSIYEIGSIIAGASAGRLSGIWSVRANIILASLVFAVGAAATAMAPTMYFALGGRLITGFGGGALISLSFIATQRFFPSSIWPQLLAVLSVAWGIAAFGGPLYGGIVEQLLSWRWAFWFFAMAAVLYALLCLVILGGSAFAAGADAPRGKFPVLALACLSGGVTAVAAAGVESRPAFAAALVLAGMAAIAVFFRLDAANGLSRLFPTAPLSWHSTVGSGMIMVAALSVSTCSFAFYGPLLLAAMHGFSPVTTGLIIASESVAWSVLSILVATAPRRYETLIVRAGAFMIAGGILGFAFAVPAGAIVPILVFAMLQGGGFGILWPFASRRIIEQARSGERDITAAGFSTMQRMGYAIGAATAGIIANTAGFSGGFSREAAASAAPWLFFSFLPLAALGCLAAIRITSPAAR